MRYWLLIINIENWKISIKKGIYGVKELYLSKYQLIQKGDEFIFYIKGSMLGGAFRVLKKFQSQKKYFHDDFYPYLLGIKAKVACTMPIELKKEVITSLAFIKNKSNWGSHLMGKAIIELSKKDFAYLKSYITQDGGANSNVNK